MRDTLPFRAALFDLDGTLLDSLWVWRDVDRRFLGARGLEVPPDYGSSQQARSFRESAAYAVARFGLDDTVESVMAEWVRLASEAYARRVALKPGARAYLRMLKRAGVRLAVATANRPEIFRAALERHGIDGLFDAVCTTADVGERGKGDGALFLLAAERLGVAPEDCVVFEDTPEAIAGARRAGMRAWWVREDMHRPESVEGLAEGVLDSFDDMRRYHAFPENAGRCVIFTALCEGGAEAAYAPHPGDCVLCADGGWRLAEAAGVRPDWVLGDFDSAPAPGAGRVLRYPVEKDDTDTMLCLRHGLALGFEDFLIVGGFGGRLDHTLANFQALNFAAARGARAEMCDGLRWATVLRGGGLRVPAMNGKLSVFALDAECRGVTIRGAKYAVEGATLTNAFPLGAGNAWADAEAEISVEEGALLIVACAPEGERLG